MFTRHLASAFFLTSSTLFALAVAPGCGSSSEGGGPPAVQPPPAEVDGGSEAGTNDGGAIALGPCPAIEQGLVSLEDAPLALATDAMSVYWISSRIEGAGSVSEVRRAPLAGGTAETVRTTTRQPGALAVASGTLYWVERAEGAAPAELRARAASGDQRVVATFAGALGEIDTFALAVDASNAYVLFKQFGGASFDYVVRVVPLAGGSSVVVATDSRPYGSDARALVLSGGDLFWGFTAGDLLRARASDRDGTAKVIFSDVAGLDAWAPTDSEIYFAQGGVLRQMTRDGGGRKEGPAAADTYRTLLSSGASLAWGAKSSSGTETIRVMRRDGSVCLAATSDVKSVFSLAIADDKLFFANTATRSAGGSVRWARLPK